jgi:hypothetical protein
MYRDANFSLPDVIARLRALLPRTELILGTNGISIPAGEWQKELSSVRVGLHSYSDKAFRENSDVFLRKAWRSIWRYYTGAIGEIWITFKYDRASIKDIFSLAERVWFERERLCRENKRLYKKELGIKIAPIADDSRPEDPFHTSKPTPQTQKEWADMCRELKHSDTLFGAYLRKLEDGFIDAGFSLPEAFHMECLPEPSSRPAGKCWPVSNYVLAAADGSYYPCPAEAARANGRRSVGTPDCSPDEVLRRRKDAFERPCGACLKGCRMLTTFMSAPVIGAIKEETQRSLL